MKYLVPFGLKVELLVLQVVGGKSVEYFLVISLGFIFPQHFFYLCIGMIQPIVVCPGNIFRPR